jgi:hypothetical protein
MTKSLMDVQSKLIVLPNVLLLHLAPVVMAEAVVAVTAVVVVVAADIVAVVVVVVVEVMVVVAAVTATVTKIPQLVFYFQIHD